MLGMLGPRQKERKRSNDTQGSDDGVGLFLGQDLRVRRTSVTSKGRNGLRSSSRIFKLLIQAIARLLGVNSVGPQICPNLIITLNIDNYGVLVQ